ncbi:MAG: hypothetical protein BROFUL_00423 [Candidatus Brocadia fulgida]|uniref:Uncharacterized protein n=1 Tax=Candidatus Brocadia fulgida TaxID=380242 RepID=A0A0M2UXM2_9BACT|nr:MAG: hypothetical protein BROFUL_00423 [Candidatus Brocadia fulgida]
MIISSTIFSITCARVCCSYFQDTGDGARLRKGYDCPKHQFERDKKKRLAKLVKRGKKFPEYKREEKDKRGQPDCPRHTTGRP